MKWIYRLEYKYGRYALENLMFYIVAGMGVVFVMEYILPFFNINVSLYSLLYFDMDLIKQGQVWRIISFVFLYPDSFVLLMALAIYFYYFIGKSLENAWGSFKFDAYYLIGVIATIIGGIIMGTTTNYYLNLSLFFAFAVLFPDEQFMLFFIIPIKAKYFAYVDAVFFIIELIVAPWAYKIALLISIANFFLFFHDEFANRAKLFITHIKSKRNYK